MLEKKKSKFGRWLNIFLNKYCIGQLIFSWLKEKKKKK